MGHKILLQNKAGLGDQMSLGAVIKNLRHYHPDWFIGVEVLPGYEGCFTGIADQIHTMVHPFTFRYEYNEVRLLQLYRPTKESYGYGPASKVAECLTNEFGLTPVPELCRYTFNISEQARKAVDQYIETDLGGQRFTLIHYQGVAGKDEKDLNDYEAELLCEWAYDEGSIPVIYNGEHTSKLHENYPELIWELNRKNPLWKQGNYSDLLAALIDRAWNFYGVDSGPEHVAAALDTPTIVFWYDYHPLYHFDPSPNVLHMVNDKWLDRIPSDALEWFEANYRHKYYEGTHTELIENLTAEILEAKRLNTLNGLTKEMANGSIST